jgi:hypothetical protein
MSVRTLSAADLECSTFQNRPAYRYIRQSDHMPALGTEVKMATVKLFNPTGAGTWYISEYDPTDRLAFGVSDLGMGCAELGYISMAELVEFRGRLGLPIERDLHFTPRLLSELQS